MDESELEGILERRRTQLGIESGKGKDQCSMVNVAVVAALKNKYGADASNAWFDRDFRNLRTGANSSMYIVGTLRVQTSSREFWLGFDGTSDQVNGIDHDVTIVSGRSEIDVLETLGGILQGDFSEKAYTR